MTLRMQIVPIDGFRLFGALVKKEIDLSRKNRGTFFRSGTKVKNRAKWSHKKFSGWINLQRSTGEFVTAEIRSRQASGADWQLLDAFVGFVVRHFRARIGSIHIHLPRVE